MRARMTLYALSLLLAAAPVFAAQPRPTLDMEADGEVQIAPDGHVSDYRLKSKLAPAVADLVDRDVRGWHFEPILVDGRPVVARTAMRLRLHAEPAAGNDRYTVRVVWVEFGEPRRSPGMKPPHYPREAVASHVGAKVLVAVRLDDTGKVVDAQVYQTSLDVRTRSEFQAEHFRRLFEKASLRAARDWRYDLSETVNGKHVGTRAIVPVVYKLHEFGSHRSSDGQWTAYVPGPVHDVPWMDERRIADVEDPGADGTRAQALESRFHLKDDVVGKLL